MIPSRRRAVFLLEMLPVLLAVAVGGTLMAVGIAAILRSHNRIAQFGNRYAVLHDFLREIRDDVRTATDVTLRGGDDGELQQVLAVGHPPRQVLYRFFEGRVERVGFEADGVPDKQWDMKHTEVELGMERPAAPGGDRVVNVTVLWHRSSKDNPEPRRRFEIALRCAVELRHEHE